MICLLYLFGQSKIFETIAPRQNHNILIEIYLALITQELKPALNLTLKLLSFSTRTNQTDHFGSQVRMK